MKVTNQKLVLICFSIIFATSTFAQKNDTDSLKKHELGVNSDFSNGRIRPGIQYYFSLDRTRQLGVNLNYLQHNITDSESIFSPQLSLEYRFKKNLVSGLNIYAAPLLTYRHQVLRNNGNTFNTGQFGLGFNTGVEYDFSKNNVPLILGAGIKGIGYYNAGRVTYDLAPSVSLRIKF